MTYPGLHITAKPVLEDPTMRLRSAWVTLLGLLFVASPLAAEGDGGGMVIGGPLGGAVLPPEN